MNKPVQGLRLPSLHLYHKVNVYISNFSPTWRPIYPADRNQEHNKGLIYSFMYSFSSVQFSRSVVANFFRPHGLQHATPPCPSPIPGLYLDSCPLSRWCHPTISFLVLSLSSRLQSFPAPGSFQRSHFFTSGGQSIGVSASTIVLPMNIQDWFPSGWTGWISFRSKGLSRVFSNITVQKHQFFSAQLSL